MTERNNPLYALLSSAPVYELVQRLFGGAKKRRQFADEVIKARPGDRVLDIGCGPGALLEYLPAVTYIGYEPNAAYVETARAQYADRGTFHVGYFDAAAAAALEPVDIVLVIAVLHHMTDDQVRELLDLVGRVLKPGGRLVTLDNAFVKGQNPIARLLISLDRGRSVRTPEGYLSLVLERFPATQGRVIHHRFPPYTHWQMTATSAT